MSVKSVISFSGSDLEETSTKSFTCSKKLIRKILQLSVINIVYNRIDLPADEFEEHRMRDIKLMVCKKSSKHPLIYRFYEWMKGANHALERDYLKEFYLLFKNRDGDLVEYYKFRFFYNFNVVDEDDNKVDQAVLQQQTKQIFADIKCLSKHKKWNENDDFIAQIEYNDKVSPSYQPPYFLNCSSTDDEDHQAVKKMEQSTKLFKLPNITTGFHTLKCLFGGDNIFVSKTPSLTASSVKTIVAEKEKYHEEPQVTLVSHSIISSPPSSPRTDEVTEINTLSASVFCMCQSTVSHKALQIIHCTSCNKPFHCVCFGFLGVAPKQFRCVTCGGSANIPETVETEDAKLFFIRLRLLIGFCNLTMQLPDKIMRGFPSVRERNEIWKNLERLEFIERKNEKYFVNRAKVTDSTLLRELFCKRTNPDSAEMVDLTEEDQESGPDVKKMKF